tara:strand:+ start:2169 stop:2948 length:780 start_codon:yes stop_codon:yes gene_type:complete
MPTFVPKYIQQYSNSAGQLGTSGMPCLTLASNPDMELDKCYFFGGYSGHKDAPGVAKRTFRVYTGPASAYANLIEHQMSLAQWITEEEASMATLWSQLATYGKSGDRIQPRGSVWGQTRREHKEKAARFVGKSYRRARALEAYNRQKTINAAMQSGGATLNLRPLIVTIPTVVQDEWVKPDLPTIRDFNPQIDFDAWRDAERDIAPPPEDLPVGDTNGDLENWPYVPETDGESEIPTWVYAAGGAGAFFLLARLFRKKE